ncbi:MAG: NUDIX domain-containing protein [Gammaproteobacteria bacterium]
MKTIDKLAWVYVKNKQLLGARSKNKDLYYIPGGKRDPGESDQEALIREIKEELSVDLKPESIVYASTFSAQAHGKPEGTMVKITCYFADFAGEIKADAEIEQVQWLSYQDRAHCSLIMQLIMDWLREDGLVL